jgi:hypothetical protein
LKADAIGSSLPPGFRYGKRWLVDSAESIGVPDLQASTQAALEIAPKLVQELR